VFVYQIRRRPNAALQAFAQQASFNKPVQQACSASLGLSEF
jgi:hypothetical protein